MLGCYRFAALLLALSIVVAGTAVASERHFGRAYESSVLQPGDVELEPWTTVRYGRDRFFLRFDQRLEIEVGVAPGLMTAWYLNLEASTQALGRASGGRQSETSFAGVSWEWKWSLSDPVADALGSALYLEGSLGPKEASIEAKIILDKQIGRWLLAVNLVGEREWIYGSAATETENVLELVGALGWYITQRTIIGVEAVSHNVVASGLQQSTLFLGPTVSHADASWWVSLSLLPQLPALRLSDEAKAGGSSLNLSDQERLSTRLLFGIHL